MNVVGFFLFFSLMFPWSIFLKSEQMRVGIETGYMDVEVLVKPIQVKAKPGRNYYWLRGNRVMHTESGYSGNLLHGDYASFFDNGQLHKQGTMNKGLKTGEWRVWNENGKLLEISNWSHGLLEGAFVEYSIEGIPVKQCEYRKGEEYFAPKKKTKGKENRFKKSKNLNKERKEKTTNKEKLKEQRIER